MFKKISYLIQICRHRYNGLLQEDTYVITTLRYLVKVSLVREVYKVNTLYHLKIESRRLYRFNDTTLFLNIHLSIVLNKIFI